MIIHIQKLLKSIKYPERDLITRPVGQRVYTALEDQLQYLGKGETLIIDFEHIQVIDSSFIDEALVSLVRRSMAEEFYIRLKNTSEIAQINIDSVFQSCAHYNNERLAVITDDLTRFNSFYLGDLDKNERSTIEYIHVNTTVQSADVETYLGITEGDAVALLEELHRLRLIRSVQRGQWAKT